MPPKQQSGAASGSANTGAGSSSKKGGSGPGLQANEQPDEDPLVAVILADSYDDFFAPLTLDTPRCLLPLANVPLINYSIESATLTGVSHIYILTSAHTDQIREHVSASQMEASLRTQGVSISVMNTPEATSEGDALRDLDAMSVIRSDFLLYRGDSVCTFDLTKAVQEHKQRRKIDKDVIMTMCCMPVQEETEMRSKAVRPVHYVDPNTNQILHYELQYHYPKRKASMPYELLRLDDKSGFDEIDVRYDLVEAGVQVCSVDVPALFSENFDYQSFSHDFVPGILTSDLLDSKFFLEVYRQGYGGRARDTTTYDAISMSILRRWAFPITPANSAWIGEAYSERKGWKYVGDGVKMDRTSVFGSGTMLGSGTTLAAQSSVSSSVLGADVQVGESSHVVNSHLHPGARLGANVKIDTCIIGRGAVLLDGVQLGRGCLVGAGCVVGPNVTLRAGSRVGLRRKKSWDEDDDDDANNDDAETAVHDVKLGAKSRGVLWTNIWEHSSRSDNNREDADGEEDNEEDDDDEDEMGLEDPRNVRLRALGYTIPAGKDDADERESVSSIEGDSDLSDMEEDDDEEDSEVESKSAISSSTFSTIAGGGGANINLTLDQDGDTKEEQAASRQRLVEFQAEARASLQRSLDEGHTVDNAAIELKTLRMASNVTLSDVRAITIEILLSKCNSTDAKQVQSLMARWAKLITLVSSDDQVDALNLIQTYCANHSSTHSTLFVPLLKIFYNDDVFEEENFVAWWRSKDSQTGGDKRLELRQKAQGVIRYILESSDDDEEETDDEE